MAKKKYKLEDGSIVSVTDVCDRYFGIWNHNISDTLARQRLTYSTDPEYIYSEKGQLRGHEYCRVAKINKKKRAAKLSVKTKIDLTRYRTGELRQAYCPYFKLAITGKK